MKVIPEERLRALERKGEFAQELVDMAKQICPECFPDITSLQTHYYPDTHAVVTVFNVPPERLEDVGCSLRRRAREIQKQHGVIIAVSVSDVADTQLRIDEYERALAKRQQTAEVK